MAEFWEVVLDAFIDTLRIVPVLLLVYFLIEFLEYKKLMEFEKSKFLKGKASPVFGSLFGSLPQCGFSVISTDLFTKGFISVGALIAVYIATSDEALPIMLSHKNGWVPLIWLLISKIILGIAIGYLAMWLYPKIFKKDNVHAEEDEHHHEEEHLQVEHTGCCNHGLESNIFDWKHPLFHCLKISLFILIVNLIFGIIIMLVGQDNLTNFLTKSSALQPLLAVIIGIIPNCASSVVITELYLLGGLSFGSILAGLSVNAGLGLIVLFKQNKNKKEIAFILSMLIIPSLIVGYALHFII